MSWASERTVRVPAGVLEYRERGRGARLCIVHGAAVNGDLWRKVVRSSHVSTAA